MGALNTHVEWVLIPVFATLTGYTEKAVRRKIGDGVRSPGRHNRETSDSSYTLDSHAY